jgi:hypothetical protein
MRPTTPLLPPHMTAPTNHNCAYRLNIMQNACPMTAAVLCWGCALCHKPLLVPRAAHASASIKPHMAAPTNHDCTLGVHIASLHGSRIVL